MSRPGLVTLLTDFGLVDPFVGVMHGVIHARFPGATVVDLTHAVAAQDVAEGSFWLERSAGYFPEGTVHVAVVDPGVGTSRRPLVVRAGGQLFVGPDNGLLWAAALSAEGAHARQIDLSSPALARFAPPRVSRTFHGRDVFAPTAAALASGEASFDEVGPLVTDPVRPSWPLPSVSPGRVEGRVATVDRFGNLLTDIDARLLEPLGASVVVRCGSLSLPLSSTYGEADEGEPLALVSSFDVLEIAVRNGDAARALGLGKGAPVAVEISGRT